MRIFVYGTLKRGRGNDYLLHGQEFLGEFLTKKQYDLFETGIPGLVEGEYQVKGEVWSVDKNTLMALDSLEGHPDWYTREEVELEGIENVQGYMGRWILDRMRGGGYGPSRSDEVEEGVLCF